MDEQEATSNKLYWEQAATSKEKAVSNENEVYDLRVIGKYAYEYGMSTLRQIEESLDLERDSTPWQETDWRESALTSKGFEKIEKSTIFAVEDEKGRAKVICVFTLGMGTGRLCELGEHVFRPSEHEKWSGSAGQSLVKRGPKKRQEGTMVMYGTQVVYGRNAACLGLPTTWQPGAYQVTGKRDLKLNQLVADLGAEMTFLEEQLTPAAAQARAARLELLDYEKKHRICSNCKGTSMAMTIGYVVSPHNDSGTDNEHILFRNTDGAMPDGHSWMFAIPLFVLGLPAEKGAGAHVSVAPGVYHGTLPSSSTAAHHAHRNLGCALVTKREVVTAMEQQQARKETTPTHLTASHVYSVT